MKKIFLSVTLSIVLTASALAGDIPITGVQGCAPGLWYPESQVCVMQKAAAQQGKPEPTFIENLMIKAVLFLRPSI